MRDAQSSVGTGTGSVAAKPLDAMTIELATGLAIADFEALGSDPSPETRAEIAVRFAGEFDRLAKASPHKLAGDLLRIFSRDPDSHVRRLFADSIKASPYLPPKIAKRLANDDIEIAAPILKWSSVLDDVVIDDIIKTRPEPYALVIADRVPLAASLVETLIEHKGTKRVVIRLLDNEDAEFSDQVFRRFRDWGLSDQDINERLRRRPNLPFEFVHQSVVELADQIQWRSLGERAMTKFEATQLQNRFDGKSGHRCSSSGERFRRMKRALEEAFERGRLVSSSLLTYLRDKDIDRLECGFVVLSGLELRWVRRCLYGSDKRALVALCLKAGFSTADYLAFRIALSLAELGSVREQSRQRYPDKNLQFVQHQFEAMRADPGGLRHWLPSGAS